MHQTALALIITGLGLCWPPPAQEPTPVSGASAAGMTASRSGSLGVRLLHGIAHPGQMVTLSAPIETVITEIKVVEGDTVEAGQMLAVMDDRVSVAAVEAAAAEAARTAMIEHAVEDVTLQQWLVDRLVAARMNNGTNAYQLQEAQSKLLQAKARHRAALEDQVQAQRALALAQARLDQHQIRAPFAGRVVRVIARAGATLTTADQVLTLVSLEHLDAELHLPVQFYHRLQVGASYPLVASAPVDRTLIGRLRTAEPIIDPATRTFRCVFEIDNPKQMLPAGFTVELDAAGVPPTGGPRVVDGSSGIDPD